jgi:hypothetical protein
MPKLKLRNNIYIYFNWNVIESGAGARKWLTHGAVGVLWGHAVFYDVSL